MDDLALLAESIRRRGAEPIILTQAISAGRLDAPGDYAELHAWLVNVPQADKVIALSLAGRANAQNRQIRPQARNPIIDVAACLSGDREAFSDLVHFRDRGAETVARIVAEAVRRHESSESRTALLPCPLPARTDVSDECYSTATSSCSASCRSPTLCFGSALRPNPVRMAGRHRLRFLRLLGPAILPADGLLHAGELPCRTGISPIPRPNRPLVMPRRAHHGRSCGSWVFSSTPTSP